MNFNLWKLDDHPELVSALFAAHREAAIANDNASKIVVQQAWGGSGRFENAMIAGLATIGALHAPLTQARDLWDSTEDGARFSYTDVVPKITLYGKKAPGFGNSFHSRGDPAFNRIVLALQRNSQDAVTRLDDLCACVRSWTKKELWPNAALYTAIVASICEVPRGLESALFALARIPAWAEMCGAVQHPVVGGVR